MVSIRKIEGLDPLEYQHPADRKALLSLEKTPGLDFLVKKFYELGFEMLLRTEFTGSNLEVTDRAFPKIYEIFEEACETLDLDPVIEPQLYFRWNDYFRILDFPTNNLQGITVGVSKPIVAISAEAIENFNDAELLFLIGCEVGRIKSKQVLYEDIARLLPVASSAISTVTFGFGGLSASITGGLQIALNQWLRMADYTADRAGLLACQNVEVAMTALAKMAGLPQKYFDSFDVHEFIRQAAEFEGMGEGIYNKTLRIISLVQRDQAFVIARAHELKKWVDSGEYQDVIDRKAKVQPPQATLEEDQLLQTTSEETNVLTPPRCRHCSVELLASHTFCPNCGKKVSTQGWFGLGRGNS